jgi:uncharacterized protein (DUF2062 family)
MIHLTRSLIRKWTQFLLHIHDSPQRTAAAYALGVFFGFSPFFGLHTILALLLAFRFNLNRVAVVLGVHTNLPWFIAPYYTITTLTAASVLGVRPPPGFAHRLRGLFELSIFGRHFWAGLGHLLHPLLWPYTLGSLVGAVVLSTLSYLVARPAIEAGRKHLHLHHPHQVPPEDR